MSYYVSRVNYVDVLVFAVQELMSTISGRVPQQVESKIKKLMENYMCNLTAVLSQFPSQKVRLTSI